LTTEKTNSWGKIGIGARLSKIDPAFHVSYINMIMTGTERDDVILAPAVTLPHSCAANFLYERARLSNCDSILYIDDDMEFAPDALSVLRNTPGGENFAMIAGLFVCRRYPYLPVVMRAADPRPLPITDLKGVVECDFTGLAFTLIRMAALKEIADANNGEAIRWENFFGEDGSLCQALRTKGHKIAVNCDVRIGHRIVLTALYDPETRGVVMGDNNFGIGRTPEPRQVNLAAEGDNNNGNS
jgi:hypothetical protein